MNKMQDGELRRMAVFKLRQVTRQLAELEDYATDDTTRASLAAIQTALNAASDSLQTDRPKMIVVEGDDESRLTLRLPEVRTIGSERIRSVKSKTMRRSA